MLKLLFRLPAWLAAPADPVDAQADLLSHPLIERMSERERGDLPLSVPRLDDSRRTCPA
ncbi:MAG: hypothetical protein KDJ87_05785 [Rhizobiaceae bacterium]|nr:hypothetical protein [Rhizobiaceae bacterium]